MAPRITRRRVIGFGVAAVFGLGGKLSAATWRQREFVVSFWSPPPPSETTDSRYAEIAEAGFNVVMGGNGVQDKEASLQMLEMSRRHGLKALVLDSRLYGGKADRVSEVLADYAKHPALYGFLLQDEPGVPAFSALGRTVDEMRRRAPELLCYINLFPNYASAEQLGCSSYAEYLSRFTAEVRPGVLSFDHYPLLRSGIREEYYENLELVRQEAVKSGVPFWVIVQAEGIRNVYRSPSEQELHWQVWNALAYGASGILYFTYWTPPESGGEEHFDGILSQDGKRRAKYEWVKELNAVLKRRAKVLFGLRSLGVYHTQPVPRGCHPVAKGPVLEGLEGGPALVGLFRVSNERTALLVVNRSPNRTCNFVLNLHDDVQVLKEILPGGEESKNLLRRDLRFPALYEGSLDAGGARLFLAERPSYRVRD